MLATEPAKTDPADRRRNTCAPAGLPPAPRAARSAKREQRVRQKSEALARTRDAMARRSFVGSKSSGAGEASVASYPPEVEHGNREYKLELASCSSERMTRLTSQLKWRLAEGGGEAVYLLGVEDDGTPLGISAPELTASLGKLRGMAAFLGAEVAAVAVRPGLAGRTAEVSVRRKRAPAVAAEARVLCLGASGAGKTTLVGVLKTDETDDGRGLARLHVLKHQHELDHGLTSTVSCHTLRYDARGAALLDSDSDQDVPSDIFTDRDEADARGAENVRDMVTLVDSAGHPRFFKSVVFGLTAEAPDAALLMVDAPTLRVLAEHASGACAEFDSEAQAQRVRMTLDMLHVCRLLRLPFTVVVTKADLVEDTGDEALIAMARGMLAAAPVLADEPEAAADAVLVCSSTTKRGVAQLRSHLGAFSRVLADTARAAALQLPPMLFVREAFDILGFDGAIVAGVLESGQVALGDELRLGPGPRGRFFPVHVRSIRTAYGLDVQAVGAGVAATFGVCLAPASADAPAEQQDVVFKKVVRRGACLARADKADGAPATQTLELRVRACLDVALGSITLRLDAAKMHQFTLRCRTVKQRVVCAQQDHAVQGGTRLSVTFVERPECVPAGAPVVLQRGSLIIFAERVDTKMLT